MDMEAFRESMQIKANIINEKQAEQARYEQGVRAMQDASNREGA